MEEQTRSKKSGTIPYRMDYVPAADGQRFLMKVPVKETPPAITVVLTWPGL